MYSLNRENKERKTMSNNEKIFNYNRSMMSSLFFPTNENEFTDAIAEHDSLPFLNNLFDLDQEENKHEW